MAEWRFQLGMLHTEAAIRNIRKSKKKKKKWDPDRMVWRTINT